MRRSFRKVPHFASRRIQIFPLESFFTVFLEMANLKNAAFILREEELWENGNKPDRRRERALLTLASVLLFRMIDIGGIKPTKPNSE
jgi:hypothetical protein